MTTTNTTLTANDVADMIDSVDTAFKGMVRDYEDFNDLPGTNSVYRIGDWGWIWEYQWDAVFAEWPDWAPLAYEIDAEEAGDEELRTGIAEAVNRGGIEELERWARTFMDTGDLSVVFWTEVGQDC